MWKRGEGREERGGEKERREEKERGEEKREISCMLECNVYLFRVER